MHNKNLLIITPYFPFPIKSGGDQAQFHMINSLRNEFNISFAFVSPRHNKHVAQLQELWPNVTFHAYKGEKKNWLYKRIRSILKHLHSWPDRNKHIINPILSHSFEEAIDYQFIDFLQNIINEKHIEIVQFEFAEYLNLAYAFQDVKKIFVQHEIHFIRNYRFLKNLQSLQAHDFYQFNMLKQQEIAAMNACDTIITLTQTDKEILQKEKVITNISISPAVIPSPYEYLPENFHFENKIIFLGGDGHKPNYEGFLWFLEQVWKDMSHDFPHIKVQAIGKWRSKHKRLIHKKYNNIEMLGYVEDIKPHLQNAIMIVPILTGSGMRMKIIDSANNGTPFITTKIGVEGLDFIDNNDCFIVNTSKDFAYRLRELITDESLQLRFRNNAFNKIKELYPTEKLIQTRSKIYNQL